MEGELVPYPQFNKGEKGAGWEVVDSGGGTSPAFVGQKGRKRVIQVPLEGECQLCKEPGQAKHMRMHARGVRNHEQAHIRYTTDKQGRLPRLPKKLKQVYWNSVEDMRMDKAIREHALIEQPRILCPASAPMFIERLKNSDDKMRILYAVASGQADWPLMAEWLRAAMQSDDPADARLDMQTIINIRNETEQNLLTQESLIVQSYYDPVVGTSRRRILPKLKAAIKTAMWLQQLLEGMGIDPDGQTQQQEQKGKNPNAGDDGTGNDIEEGDDEESYDPTEEKPAAEEDASGNDENEDEGEGEADESPDGGDPATKNPNAENLGSGWGTMTIVEKPLVRPLPGRLRQGFSSSDTGTMIGDLARWMTDQRIFKTNRSYPGGTVLLDDSGSMSLTQEQIYEVMCAVPGVVFAAYAGDGVKGILQIIAARGKVAAEDDCQVPMGTNTIDGPALAWLGRQKDRPLIWVSDGWVNGTESARNDSLLFDRDMLLRRHGIRWLNPHYVGGIENVPEWLKKMLLGRDVKKGGEVDKENHAR